MKQKHNIIRNVGCEEQFFGTYMERPYSHSSYYIFDTIGIQICDGAGDDCKKPQTDGSRRCT